METTANVEILVHVTAPCRTADDARYRALAQAYLDFSPTSQTKIISKPPPSPAEEVIPSSQAELPVLPAWSDAPPPIPSSDATQPATSSPVRPLPPPPTTFGSFVSFRSQELSFRSVLDNRNSPGLARPLIPRDIILSSQPEAGPQRTQGSWQAPPSTIGDSQPLNTISLAEFSSPSRLFEHLACQFDSQPAGVSQQHSGNPRYPALPVDSTLVPTSEEDEGEDDDQVVLVTSSNLPTAGSEATPGPASSVEHVVLRTPFPAFKRPLLPSSPFEQVIQDTPCQPSKKRPLPSSPTRAGSEPPLSSKRHRRSAPISESRSVITRSSSDAGVVPSDLYRPIRPPNERHLNYLERLEIHPVGPPVGTTDLTPDDLLTPKLRELARQLNISKRYAPVEQKRELRPFERGYWQLDWTSWRPTLRERAWHFLTDYILEGFAGWGVWCKRAEDWTRLRVYCWGHIAGHVYLALYLASERALKKDAARWVDGAGEVVVITRGHENSESGESMDDGPDGGT
ncbi:hypothetical protein ColTof4_08144 [Colletotrichum tofieldiae]|uniref:Uncharacterized protein n=1 Tax=Colletotrichum tofieldiae TaxID=708197 RepID=A0A166UK34_9PEZI|nr:hypothetical protein CT0861_03445 [Colletotrichum tofieldiae]GKT54995.1 hypothetical protein ColTof3_02334 [Colletotrichum tofieldiae]GKT75721.1 hypothetical protein ColTof4_08144 [Colletotrichum tofieldiae]GKT83414.1 hypothetical protein Ct61P_01264 [Colletotrichum tofieldiae]